ncbi:adenine nucleotide alpha hydrolases-like protein [Xylariaceae sp. FL0016]|nr:adenine nucleotide alpha hydrolases-like protein [Xylariaceae sp. FL0016]
MDTLPYNLHTAAKPISIPEFLDAVRATCPPRFPRTRGVLHRGVALAVSGGVDSMALAYLCSQARNYDKRLFVSDNPVNHFRAFIVDHRAREGSEKEAIAVRAELRKLGLRTDIYSLSWSRYLSQVYPGQGHFSWSRYLDSTNPSQAREPKDLPNFESVARTLRYQRLGAVCSYSNMVSLLVGHHEDDQYETVLMRLLRGHDSRGLRGIRRANDIPECETEFGSYQSGFVDDQKQKQPYYQTTRKDLKRELLSLRPAVASSQLEEYAMPLHNRLDWGQEFNRLGPKGGLPRMDIEDGGVMVYRPLLEFSKGRLIATCEANGVNWFEDHTNHDATLTPRNAVRHMVKECTLPKALQKPAILALAKRCERRARAMEAEANRLLERVIFHEFEPNVGTLIAQFPTYGLRSSQRHTRNPSYKQARVKRQREVSGYLLQKIIALVSPKSQLTPIVNLKEATTRLFPALSPNPDERSTKSPTSFVISEVHFVPVTVETPHGKNHLCWQLSRAPYTSFRPHPRFRTTYFSISKAKGHWSNRWNWSSWLRWTLWDGRYWIRLSHRLPYRVVVAPFSPSHAKAFREALAPHDREQLEAMLKRYAPGKVRWTLPALYVEDDLDLSNVRPRADYADPGFPYPPELLRRPRGDQASRSGGAEVDRDRGSSFDWSVAEDPAPSGWVSDQECRKGASPYYNERTLDMTKAKMLCLPTLQVGIPLVDDWLQCEVRYRKADLAVRETAGTFDRGCFVARPLRPRVRARMGRKETRIQQGERRRMGKEKRKETRRDDRRDVLNRGA